MESLPSTKHRPRLLIVSGNLALLNGHYEGVIGGLVRMGVSVSIRYLRDSALSVDEYRATLREAGIEADVAPLGRGRRVGCDVLALRLREIGNILRFAHPDYAGKQRLSERSFEKKAGSAQRWGRWLRRLGPRGAAVAARIIAWAESTLPAPRSALALLDEEQPAAVAVVPVIRVPALVDFLKAGAERRASTAIWVQSWDNLTNKGLLHFSPDRVFVWNDRQKEELRRYHGVAGDRVCVTGAQTFDHWFSGARPLERDAFCANLGVDPERPVILYLSSSKQIAPHEPAFFERWLRAVRASGDPLLESATILVRPHPTMVEEWYARELESEPGVVLSPATRRDRLNSSGFREQYRAELHHATLAFGVNTSGLIDAAIFGKPACTVELPELYDGQRGTIHFEHLARPDGGLLRTSSSLDDHVATLSELIRRDTYAVDERSERFVRGFVRPHGLDLTPVDVFVQEMLRLCREPSHVARRGLVARAVGAALAVAAAPAGRVEMKRLRKKARNRGRWLVSLLVPKRVRRPAKRLLRKASRRAVRAIYRLTARVVPGRLRRALRRRVRASGEDGAPPGAHASAETAFGD